MYSFEQSETKKAFKGCFNEQGGVYVDVLEIQMIRVEYFSEGVYSIEVLLKGRNKWEVLATRNTAEQAKELMANIITIDSKKV